MRLATSAKSKGRSDFVVEGKNAIGFTRLRRDFGVAGVAINRFDNTVLAQQLEEVTE